MADYEYRVVPAPKKAKKSRGAKGPEARFARTVEAQMNDMAVDGWEFLRSETLPSEERSGLTSSHTVWRTVLIYRRPRDGAENRAPRLLEAPGPREDAGAPAVAASSEDGAAPAVGPAPTVSFKEMARRSLDGRAEPTVTRGAGTPATAGPTDGGQNLDGATSVGAVPGRDAWASPLVAEDRPARDRATPRGTRAWSTGAGETPDKTGGSS